VRALRPCAADGDGGRGRGVGDGAARADAARAGRRRRKGAARETAGVPREGGRGGDAHVQSKGADDANAVLVATVGTIV